MIALLWLACSDPREPEKSETSPLPETTTAPTPSPTGGPSLPAVCDAGDEVWVQRVFPLVLGRRVHGAVEVGLWADLAAAEGRPAVVRALAESPEFDAWWKAQLSDLLYVARDGAPTDETCFDTPLRSTHDGQLAAFIRDNDPAGAPYSRDFTMADVLTDALRIDDMSVAYQANLFTKNVNPTIMVFSDAQAEAEFRRVQGDELLTVYTNRDVSCMTCHNSEYSVTDSPDPALDRSWGRGALFELALFGASGGPPVVDDFYAMNKGFGAVQTFLFGAESTRYDQQPWGLSPLCGAYATYDRDFDFLGIENAYFGGDYGETGSVWDIERLFARGVASMAGVGPQIAGDGTIDPAQAFAYLTAQNFVDQIWRLAFGNRLLLPYGLSRNQAQQERLAVLTDAFAADQWSLVELLVGVTADPYFNAGLPSTCSTEPYGFAPVVDPYTVLNAGEQANNGPGDLVHRYTARMLLNGTYDALEWGPPPEYFDYQLYNTTDPEADLQIALGVFLSEASPGFNGIDFQGTLSWEAAFYRCEAPDGEPGYLRTLFTAAVAADATVEELVLSLKDRLLARGMIEDDTEAALVADLLGVPLDSGVADADPTALQQNLGLLCGVLTQSPEFMMTTEPLPVGPPPRVDPRSAQACANFEALTTAAGLTTAGCP